MNKQVCFLMGNRGGNQLVRTSEKITGTVICVEAILRGKNRIGQAGVQTKLFQLIAWPTNDLHGNKVVISVVKKRYQVIARKKFQPQKQKFSVNYWQSAAGPY